MIKLVAFYAVLPILATLQDVVLLGGKLSDNNTAVYSAIVKLAGGPGKARIGVISASLGNVEEGNRVIRNLLRNGAKSAAGIPLSPTKAQASTLAAQVRDLTGIFLIEDSGVPHTFDITTSVEALVKHKTVSHEPPHGAVAFEGPTSHRMNLVNTLRPSGKDSLVMTAIRTMLSKGGMVAGNGAFMSDATMILQGGSVGALVAGSNYSSSVSISVKPAYSQQGGLGLVRGYVIDSHFSESGREFRLIRALVDTKNKAAIGTTKGLGIDENTALVVSNPLTNPVAKVVTAVDATTGVFYVDVANIGSYSIQNATYNNVPFSFMTSDDTINLKTSAITFASWKTNMTGEEWFPTAVPSYDILSLRQPSQWRLTARYLIDCKQTSVTSYSPPTLFPLNVPLEVKVVLNRTRAQGFGADWPDTSQVYAASFTNMMASIKVTPYGANY